MQLSVRHFILGMVMAVVPTGVGMALASRQEPVVSDPSPTFLPQPTPTPTPTPTPPPSPKASEGQALPAPTPTPAADLYELTNRYAGQYGIDANVLRHIGQCESGFNPGALNGPYAGLFQFSAPTWRSNRNLMGEDPDPALRINAEEAIQTAAWMLSVNKAYSWPNCLPK